MVRTLPDVHGTGEMLYFGLGGCQKNNNVRLLGEPIPIGPTGPTGPIGPTGPTGPNVQSPRPS
jgi:hypothetical protein